MTFKDYVNESVKKMSDEKIDSFIQKEWDGNAQTFEYDDRAIMEIAMLIQDDVLITKDKKFFHIPGELSVRMNNQVRKIIMKYGIKDLTNEKFRGMSYLHLEFEKNDEDE